MIAFDCPHCHKPLIVPNSKAGSRQPCPGCREAVDVPLPRQRPWAARHSALLTWLAVAGVAAAGLAWKSYRDREPERVKLKVAAALQGQAPQWQGFDWEKCDPQVGDYRFSVFHLSPRKRYVFAVTRFTPVDQTAVLIDPAPGDQTALASLIFTAGETESFRYSGSNDEERDELEALSLDIARALAQTVR